jgi:hypothetical protein
MLTGNTSASSGQRRESALDANSFVNDARLASPGEGLNSNQQLGLCGGTSGR